MDQDTIRMVKDKGTTQRSSAIKIIVIIVVILIVILAVNPFVIVGPGERGIVLNFGAVQPMVWNEGIHVKIPFVQRVILMDVRVHKSQTEAESVSKDLQDTHSTVAVNYHIQPETRRVGYTRT